KACVVDRAVRPLAAAGPPGDDVPPQDPLDEDPFVAQGFGPSEGAADRPQGQPAESDGRSLGPADPQEHPPVTTPQIASATGQESRCQQFDPPVPVEVRGPPAADEGLPGTRVEQPPALQRARASSGTVGGFMPQRRPLVLDVVVEGPVDVGDA